MAEPTYRDPAPASLLPLAGARVFTLARQGHAANLALAAVWMGTLLVVVIAGIAAEGRVPEPMLPFVAPPLVLGGLAASFWAHRRVAGRHQYRLHVAAERRILERISPAAAFDLDDAQLRATRYVYSVRATRYAMPTVSITLPDRSTVVIAGPAASWGIADPYALSDRSGAPHAQLDDGPTFEALRRAGG